MPKRKREMRFTVTVSVPIKMTEAEARRELESLIPNGTYARMNGYTINPKRVQPMPGFVATFGDTGLEVDFYYDKPALLREAVEEAENQHDAGQLDSYIFEERI
jgi:hypothetical protein